MKLKWKKALAAVGVVAMNCSLWSNDLLIVKAANSSFPDVSNTDVHAGAIEYLKGIGLVSGYPDGTFKPNNTINRAEALKMIFLARQRLSLGDPSISEGMGFSDVKKSDWFYSYVHKAFNLKIVEGYSDKTFKPANEITQAESLKIVLLALLPSYQNSSLDKDVLADVKKSDWFAPYVSFALTKQYIEPLDTNSWLPQKKISRAEFAELIYRVDFAAENKLDKFPLSQNWNYCQNTQQAYKIKYPPSWEKIGAGDQLILWKKDVANSQVSFARVYPNSAVMIVAVDKNPQKLSLNSYLDTLEYGQTANKQVISLNGLPYASIFVEQSGLQDSYFEMPNGQILIIYAQVGEGTLSTLLKEQIRYVIGSVRESVSGENYESCQANNTGSSAIGTTSGTTAVSTQDQLVSEILKKVLISGQSQSALDLVKDEVLLETDSIGIGTGPVDYYYSAQLNLTLKIDRNSKTLLASKRAKTSSF